ncbi:MAG: AmmeMemoRadiSam system protein B [bacterium]|nr:AmmeMemoRadiSam system protein B [bacterium]
MPRITGILKASASGRFYPDQPAELRENVERYLKEASVTPSRESVFAVLTPHAGYPFSGPVAGASFRFVQEQPVDTVLFVALAHQGVEGASVFQGVGYETPLGFIENDRELAKDLIAGGYPMTDNLTPHIGEHSVEVNLPFVQIAFPKARAASILISEVSPGLCATVGERIAQALRRHSNQRILLAVSSDMSHYPRYETAERVDRAMLETVKTLDPARVIHDLDSLVDEREPNLHCVMCGGAAMVSTIHAARAMGAEKAVILGYRNSGDSGLADRSRVVGYGSLAIMTGKNDEAKKQSGSHSSLSEADQKELLSLARRGLEAEFNGSDDPSRSDRPALQREAGVFVTLKRHGELRGCLGRFDPEGIPLFELVPLMAVQSATHDHRFSPLRKEELAETDIQASVLSPLRLVEDVNEIQVGRDGLQIVARGPLGGRRAGTLLPQVATERGWSVYEFLEATCTKAGLSVDAWKQPGTEIYAYSAEVFGDLDFGAPPFA